MANHPDARVIDAVLDAYDLAVDEIVPVRFVNNAVYRLRTAAGDLALRIHRPGYRSPEHIRSELTYLAALRAAGEVAVPDPVTTPDGDLVASVEVDGQPHHASVVTWVEGKVLRPGSGAGPRTLFRIGRALGQIHRLSESFEAPDGFELPVWDVAALFAPPSPSESAYRRMLEEVRRRAEARLLRIRRTPATYGVIHNDFILLNCLHAGGRTAVIDFDDCGWGFYLQDLGGLLGNLRDYPGHRARWRSFIEGYDTVRAVPSADEADLDLMIALRHCATVGWLLGRRNAGAISGEPFRRNLEYRIGEVARYLEAQ